VYLVTESGEGPEIFRIPGSGRWSGGRLGRAEPCTGAVTPRSGLAWNRSRDALVLGGMGRWLSGSSGPAGKLVGRFLLTFGLLVEAGGLVACRDDVPLSSEVRIPHPAEWTDNGTAILAGRPGSWDSRLSGALSPATVVKKGGTYFLYYIGADGDRQTPPGGDGGPRHRALGVATSQDGVHFTKHEGNPVISFLPTPHGINEQEEGVFSAAAVNDAGKVMLYFGGMTMVSGTGVRIDVYHTASEDGVTFAPEKKVLDTDARDLWGNEGRNDEILPAGLLKRNGAWNLYYLTKNRRPGLLARLITNGRDGTWDYGLVAGSESDQLDASRRVLLQEESALGGEYRQLSPVRIGPDVYALFLLNYDADEPQTNLEVRMASGHALGAPGDPHVAYTFDGKYSAIVFLDEAAGKWFMYYRDDNDKRAPIRVKTAPVSYLRR
jgi:hypothetical protein